MNPELRWTALPVPSPAQLQHYRLSDGERDAAISALADAYAEGRLDVTEFESRMAAASQARVVADLDPLFADLPASHVRIEPRRESRPSPAARRTSARRGHRHPPWGLIPLLFLALLLAATHAWIVIPLMILLTQRAHRVRCGLRTTGSGRLTQRGW